MDLKTMVKIGDHLVVKGLKPDSVNYRVVVQAIDHDNKRVWVCSLNPLGSINKFVCISKIKSINGQKQVSIN